MILDIPNTFVQADAPDNDSEKIIIKIKDSLVDILLEIDKDKHKDFVIYSRKDKLLYVKILKAIYSILAASILYCKKFRKDIKVIGHKANPYDMCLANIIIRSKWHILT
jgi:hypothetical protein